MELQQIIALIIFIGAYVVISTDLFNKTIAVLLGGSFFVLVSIFFPEGKKIIPDAQTMFLHIDWNVIFLLISMMILVGIIKRTGLSQFLAIKAAKAVKGNPLKILILFCLLTLVCSAFLGTVTTVLLFVPVSILIAVELDVTPLPFIISEAMAANIGGLCTLVGDPTTIMVGSAFNLDFLDYTLRMLPFIFITLCITLVCLVLFFRGNLKVTNERKARIRDFNESELIENPRLMIKSVVVLALVVAGFLLSKWIHVEVSVIALFGAALLMLLAGSKEVDHFFAEVEWGTIFFFIGLFILVSGVVETGLIKMLGVLISHVTNGNIKILAVFLIWVSGFVSAVVDNIPYVATMIPVLKEVLASLGVGVTQFATSPAAVPLWMSLLLGADLGGNGTLVGASANVVSAGLAGKSGFKISFWDFTKYGALITLINLTAVTGLVYLFYLR